MTRRAFCLSLAVFAFASPVLAHGYKKKAIEIIHPWTYEQDSVAPPDAIIGMELRNTGKVADRLLRVETMDAVTAEIVGGPGAIPGKDTSGMEIKAGQTLDLHAKGPHVLLRGVKPKLFAYNQLRLILIFERAGRIKVDVQVEEKPEPKPAVN